jgi:hypothetical protein
MLILLSSTENKEEFLCFARSEDLNYWLCCLIADSNKYFNSYTIYVYITLVKNCLNYAKEAAPSGFVQFNSPSMLKIIRIKKKNNKKL